jgi:Tfp pilus assembly protein FimT
MGKMRLSLTSSPHSTCSASSARGLSVLELVVSLAIILIISGMAIGPIAKTVKTYQLNDAANQVAGIVKFTRFEAIRRNKPIKCVNFQAAAYAEANIWADNDGDNVAGTTEKQILLSPNATLVSAGVVPNTSALAAAANIPTLTPISPGDAIKFDQRGAVVASPPAVYVFYVGNTSPSGGFRAVIVLPSGSVQVWTYAGGTGPVWQQIS